MEKGHHGGQQTQTKHGVKQQQKIGDNRVRKWHTISMRRDVCLAGEGGEGEGTRQMNSAPQQPISMWRQGDTSRACAVLYYTVLYCTILYYTVLRCTVLYCTILYYTALYCTTLHCATRAKKAQRNTPHIHLFVYYTKLIIFSATLLCTDTS